MLLPIAITTLSLLLLYAVFKKVKCFRGFALSKTFMVANYLVLCLLHFKLQMLFVDLKLNAVTFIKMFQRIFKIHFCFILKALQRKAKGRNQRSALAMVSSAGWGKLCNWVAPRRWRKVKQSDSVMWCMRECRLSLKFNSIMNASKWTNCQCYM